MGFNFIKFNDLAFSYPSSPEVIFQDINLHLTRGWYGVVGSNGAGKSTMLELATGRLTPVKGTVDKPDYAIYCPQRTDAMPEEFLNFSKSFSKTACIIRGKLHIGNDWVFRWSTLSHGERKRAQIGLALWQEPDALAIDEPTNHLDSQARALVREALSLFDGIGILVSHDRELLDSLCQYCLFVEPPQVVVRKGGYTRGKQTTEEENKSLIKQRAIKKQALKKLKREAGRRRNSASQADKERSKKGLSTKDHDAKQKIDGARLTGKDGVAGKLLRQIGSRVERARKDLDGIRTPKEHSLGIWLPGVTSLRDRILDLPEGIVELGGGKYLEHPALPVMPEDRIGITGPNGAGKSTLIQKMKENFNVDPAHLTYLPQEISAAQSRAIIGEVRRLPNEQKGRLMTIVSCLGSRPQRLLESATPSPGEIRKLSLALGMVRDPHVIVLDEPTNHMDLPSIECLEQALMNCPCALVLVSHDRHFLDKLVSLHWSITKTGKSFFQLNTSI